MYFLLTINNIGPAAEPLAEEHLGGYQYLFRLLPVTAGRTLAEEGSACSSAAPSRAARPARRQAESLVTQKPSKSGRQRPLAARGRDAAIHRQGSRAVAPPPQSRMCTT